MDRWIRLLRPKVSGIRGGGTLVPGPANLLTSPIVPNTSVVEFQETFREADSADRRNALVALARTLEMDRERVAAACSALLSSHKRNKGDDLDVEDLQRFHNAEQVLRDVLVCNYERWFYQVISLPDGLKLLLELRSELLKNLEKTAGEYNSKILVELRVLESNLRRHLMSWLSTGFLEVRRISMDKTEDHILEKIRILERVHPYSQDLLPNRLGAFRRCFAFFHPNLQKEPLAFVHVFLSKSIPSTLSEVTEFQVQSQEDSEFDSSVAVFYSISSTQHGLKGIDLGHNLIKKVTHLLASEFPNIFTFVTLSPIPGFRTWLDFRISLFKSGIEANVIDESLIEGLEKMKSTELVSSENLLPFLEMQKPVLLQLVMKYLVNERKRGRALDPVAK